MLAARQLPWFEAQARERQGERTDLKQEVNLPANLPERDDANDDHNQATEPRPTRHEREARSEAADMLGVSPRAVQSAKKVIEHGTPGLVDAVERGEVAVSAADRHRVRFCLHWLGRSACSSRLPSVNARQREGTRWNRIETSHD